VPGSGRSKAARGRGRLTGGVVWIGIVAGLLAGVVALNVAVLQLNLRMDRVNDERARLRAEDAALQSELSSASASGRIEALAHRRLGVVSADPAQTTYVDLGR
jgi:cell division protein FtsL